MSKNWFFIPISVLIAVAVFLSYAFMPKTEEEPKEILGVSLKTSGNKFPVSSISIIITGDIMLGRSVMTKSLKKENYNPNYPFEKVAETLKDADLTLGNLENPIIKNCPRTDSGFKFCADPEMIKGLLFAGVDIVSLANNHTKNYGSFGFDQTKRYLTDNDIYYIGDNNLIEKEIEGTTFGFLGFDFVAGYPNDSDIELVKKADKNVDVLFVIVHWGEEYTSKPNEFQRVVAKQLIGGGADVVVGSHPHWTQNFEYVDEKPVFYSLGNFVFDQPWSEETKRGEVVKIIFDRDKIANIKIMPVYMETLAQPIWAD